MILPEELSQRLTEAGGRSPRIILRGLCDLDGNPGDSWVLCDGAAVFLFSSPGDRMDHLPFWEIDSLKVHDDGAYAVLDVRSGECKRTIRFSLWDRRDLDALSQEWTDSSGRPAEQGTRFLKAPATARPQLSPGADDLSPVTALCASIHAMVMVDGRSDAAELFVLQSTLHDPAVIEEGRQWLFSHGVEGLLRGISDVLDAEQKLCLLTNLAAVAMADGMWRTREQRLLERFQKTLEVADDTFQPFFDVLMILNNLSVLEAAPDAKPEASPVILFAASLHALAKVDGELEKNEMMILNHMLPDGTSGNEGIRLLEREGVEGIITLVSRSLDQPQSNCLMANLLKLAMVDGVLRSREQSLMERFRQALRVSDDTWNALHRVMMVKNNLTIFAKPAA